MIYKINIILLLLAVNSNLVQKRTKPDLYILFKEDNIVMSKQVRKSEKPVVKNGKIISDRFDYDIYTYSDSSNSQRYRLATINKNDYWITTTSFVKRNGVKFSQIKNIKNIHYDTTDFKKFPYRKVFVVEYLKNNQYKVIQVNTYMGSDY